MGLTRTPPHQSTTSLLPRPLPPPYPSGQPPVAVSPEATSSRVTLDAPPRNVPVLASVSISARTDEEGNDAVMEEGDSTLEPQPMDVDVPVPPLQVSSLAVSDPAPVPATPTSRRKASSSSAEPSQAAPRPKPTTAAAAAATTATTTTTAPSDHDYGKHYDMLLQALEVAVRKGANKWTAKDLQQSFPLLSSAHPQAFQDIWQLAARSLRENMLDQSNQVLDAYKAGPGLKAFHDMIKAGVPADVEKASAWQPDLEPSASVSAMKLPLYDSIYEEMSSEYIELHARAAESALDLERKTARLAELQSEILQSTALLDETVQVFGDIPNEQMVEWMEQVVGTMGAQTRQKVEA